MSELGKLYKKAHELVLKQYEDEPEDQWKINAIYRSRLGEKGMNQPCFNL